MGADDEQSSGQSRFVTSYKSWASYLPGISIIRNHVINPLLVATEKVVEQYMPVIEEECN